MNEVTGIETPVTSLFVRSVVENLRQRFDVEEELEPTGRLHSQEELQIDAGSGRQRCSKRYRAGRHAAVVASA